MALIPTATRHRRAILAKPVLCRSRVRRAHFAIYSTNLAYSRVYKPVPDALGLTYTQYVIIICLWEEDDHTVKGLSEKLFL